MPDYLVTWRHFMYGTSLIINANNAQEAEQDFRDMCIYELSDDHEDSELEVDEVCETQ